jgi:hypothetical protein
MWNWYHIGENAPSLPSLSNADMARSPSLRHEPEVPAELLRALFGNVTEPTGGLNRVRNGSFRQASKFPLVAENCRWQALHLKTRRHRYNIGSV